MTNKMILPFSLLDTSKYWDYACHDALDRLVEDIFEDTGEVEEHELRDLIEHVGLEIPEGTEICHNEVNEFNELVNQMVKDDDTIAISNLLAVVHREVDCDSEMYYETEIDNLVGIVINLIDAYEKRYKTKAGAIVWTGTRSSHYGAIGGNGATGGDFVAINPTKDLRYTELYQGLFGNLTQNADDIRVVIDEDRNIVASFSDHDGTNTVTMYLVTENEYTKAEEQSYDTGEEVRYLLFQSLGNKKPVKISKSLIKRLYDMDVD